MTPPLKADQQAAERVLRAAVRRAREVIADADTERIVKHGGEVVRTVRIYDHPHVVAMLTAAATAAELLLEERDA